MPTPAQPPESVAATARAATVDTSRLLAETFLAGVEHHELLASTNDHARRLPPETRLPHLVLATEQTAGRGRGANSWWTGRGSLAMSLVVDPAQHGMGATHVVLASLACAVALAETIRAVAPTLAVGLHWPNDIFAEGRKLSGILIEGVPSGPLVIGIGVNTNNSLVDAPAELRSTAVSLLDLTGRPCDHTGLLCELLHRIEEVLDRLAVRPGAIARAADALCLQHGRALEVLAGPQTIAGRCLGIADDGALLLETNAGARRVYSGALVKR